MGGAAAGRADALGALGGSVGAAVIGGDGWALTAGPVAGAVVGREGRGFRTRCRGLAVVCVASASRGTSPAATDGGSDASPIR